VTPRLSIESPDPEDICTSGIVSVTKTGSSLPASTLTERNDVAAARSNTAAPASSAWFTASRVTFSGPWSAGSPPTPVIVTGHGPGLRMEKPNVICPRGLKAKRSSVPDPSARDSASAPCHQELP
jgi:hypothetical protein